MSKIDWSLFKFGKGQPLVLEKHRKDVKADAKLEAAYRKVEKRDEQRCRVTGEEVVAVSSNDKRRREHHHLKGRRVRPEWRTSSERIILVSAYCHRLLTDNILLAHGTDARKVIRFSWNERLVKPGKALFRLRPEIAKAAA